VVVTADPVETAAILRFASGPVLQCLLFQTGYSVFDFRAADGPPVRVASVELSGDAAAVGTELRRLSVAHPDAVLLSIGVGDPDPSAASSVGDVLVGADIVDGTRTAHSSRDLVQIARQVEAGRGVQSGWATAVIGAERAGGASAQAWDAAGRMRRLMVRGAGSQAGRTSTAEDRERGARAAAAFGLAVLAEHIRLGRLERENIPGTDPLAPTTGRPPVTDLHVALAEEVERWIDQVCADEELLADDAGAAELAASDFFAADSLAAFELVLAAAARVDDVARTWAAQRLRAYGRSCAQAMASLCDIAPVPPGSPSDISVRFPVEAMLQRNPAGAAVMLSVPEAWRCLDDPARGRVLTGLSAGNDCARPPTEIGWRCLLDLAEGGELSDLESRQLDRTVRRSNYDLLAAVGIPFVLVVGKLLEDLNSAQRRHRDLAARFLYREAARLPGQLPYHLDYEVGRYVQHASRAGSGGADEALSRANLMAAPTARKAGVLMSALLIDDQYLRLEQPTRLRSVLAAASLAGDLPGVLSLATDRLPPPVDDEALSLYLVQETRDRLSGLGRYLRPDEAALWCDFTTTLAQRI
jgi:hypothetical protein